MYALSSNPAIKIQEVSCIPNTPNTILSCIGALVRRRDDKIQVIWMVMHVKCIHELCIIMLIFQSYLHHIRVISLFYIF